MATKVATAAAPPSSSLASKAPIGDGLKAYYQGKIEELELAARDKAATLRRLEAQRNELNSKGGAERRRWRERWRGGNRWVFFFHAKLSLSLLRLLTLATLFVLFAETKPSKRLSRSSKRSSLNASESEEELRNKVDFRGRALLLLFSIHRVFFSLFLFSSHLVSSFLFPLNKQTKQSASSARSSSSCRSLAPMSARSSR